MGTTRPPSGGQWLIESGKNRAVIVEVGGGIRSYEFDGWPVLDGYSEPEVAPGAAGQVLTPWPNRIRDGRYVFGEQDYALPLTEPEHLNAAHGLARWLPWHAEETGTDHVRLACLLPAQAGYPWSLSLGTTWSVASDGLRVVHTATNVSASPCPYGLGVHPYLQLPSTSVDDIVVALSARSRLAVDDRLLPTDQIPVGGTEYDFRAPHAIGAAVLDTTFTDLDPGSNAVHLSSSSASVRVWAGDEFRWWQLFTGDTLPPPRRRRAVAVEPMTCPPDAFRSGRDLVTLQPGATWQGMWGITPEVP